MSSFNKHRPSKFFFSPKEIRVKRPLREWVALLGKTDSKLLWWSPLAWFPVCTLGVYQEIMFCVMFSSTAIHDELFQRQQVEMAANERANPVSVASSW